MIRTYRKITTIRAEQFDGSRKMIKKYGIEDSADSGYNDSDWEDEGLCIPTKEGYLRSNNGDWISTDANGEYWTIDDDVFKKTYAELPVIPENVAYVIKQAKKDDYKLGWVFYATYTGLWKVSICNWIRTNTDMFARAWLDGYQLEAQHDTRTN